MAYQINIANREISPRVINFFQFENQVNTLEFTLDNYIYDEVDLRNYKAYAHSTINGVVDITELEMAYDDTEDKLKLTWNVGDYTLTQEGGITYQIVFKQNADDGTGSAAWYSYNAVIINRGSGDADHKIVAEFPTIMTQWLHRIDELAESALSAIIYIDYGKDILVADRIEGRIYYRYLDAAHKSGQFEDHNKNILTPELVAKNVAIDTIDGVEGKTVQAALESLQNNIENKDTLPIQAGMSGKYLTTDGETASWNDVPRGLPLFGHIWSDHLFNDASYLRADTFSWQDGDIYVAAYNELEKEYNNGTEEVEGDIVFKRGASGYKICSADKEEALANLYAITGVAWYYIIDTANKRFKLPRKLSEALDTAPVVGNGESIGLGLSVKSTKPGIYYGDYIGATQGYNAGLDGYTENNLDKVALSTDPTKSGIIADLSSVSYKEASEYKYLYFYVGNYVRNLTEINVGEMAERVNEKVDIDASNLSVEGKSFITNLSMPDYTAPVIVSNPFTCPTDGYLKVFWNGNYTLKVDGVQQAAYEVGSGTTIGGHVFIPLSKGSVIESTISCKFYPCIGAK